MKRSAFALCLTLSVLTLPNPAGAATTRDPVLAAGRVLDSTGAAVAGPIEVRAWPTGLPLAPGDNVPTVSVARGDADQDGRFEIRAARTPELEQLAAVNSGYVNFSAITPDGGEWHFSRYLGEGAAPLGQHLERGNWPERPGEAPEAMEIQVTEPAPDRPGHFRAMAGFCQDYQVVDTKRASTMIGEINAESDTILNSFSYGEGNSADSDISVATKSAHGVWKLAGDFHVGTEKVATVGHEGGRGESLWFTSGFDYHLMRDKCGNEKITVHQWRGGIENRPQMNMGCTADPYRRHRERYGAGGKFDRSERRAMTWSRAAEVFGVGLSSRSGFSQNVQMHLVFGQEAVHWVCGDNAVATHSGRVFSGESSPI